MSDDMETKKCSHCDQVHPLDWFGQGPWSDICGLCSRYLSEAEPDRDRYEKEYDEYEREVDRAFDGYLRMRE